MSDVIRLTGCLVQPVNCTWCLATHLEGSDMPLHSYPNNPNLHLHCLFFVINFCCVLGVTTELARSQPVSTTATQALSSIGTNEPTVGISFNSRRLQQQKPSVLDKRSTTATKTKRSRQTIDNSYKNPAFSTKDRQQLQKEELADKRSTIKNKMNKLDLQRILDAQQEKFEEMLARVLKKQAGNGQEEIETSIYCKLSSLISEFSVDIPRDITFDSWFSKNKSYFEEEGKALPESSKVRLLLSKLGSEEYARIERKLLPTKLSEMKFWDLVSELKREFGDPKSQLVKRYEALNLKCQGLEDVIEFGSRVNAQCEKAQMALSIEEIKILIYISGLPSEEQSLRQLAMRFVETKKKQAVPVILKDVIEECRLHLANKAEAVLIAEKPTMVREHAVKVNLVKADNEQPPKEVKEKEEKWKPERQWVPKQVQCEFCGKKGHVKQDCWHYKNNYPTGPYCGVGEICDPEDNFKVQEWLKKKVKVNGHTMEMIIDSGSQINAVTPEVWEDIGAPKLEQVDYKGKGFGDKDFEIEGKWKCIMEIEDKDIIVEMHVVKGSKNIIGLPVLHKISENEEVKSSKKKKCKFRKGSVQKVNILPKGTKVIIKNTNNRTGNIEWLKGEVVRKNIQCMESESAYTKKYSDAYVQRN
uniref:CCHC-type domain-containing protein n=1 Tax=Meloidogyne enterolobii TaxID=390850 RepID=A0A6V7U0K0_MELEN|nr:unnamed protein product [Meloidogyne enterolobii]